MYMKSWECKFSSRIFLLLYVKFRSTVRSIWRTKILSFQNGTKAKDFLENKPLPLNIISRSESTNSAPNGSKSLIYFMIINRKWHNNTKHISTTSVSSYYNIVSVNIHLWLYTSIKDLKTSSALNKQTHKQIYRKYRRNLSFLFWIDLLFFKRKQCKLTKWY